MSTSSSSIEREGIEFVEINQQATGLRVAGRLAIKNEFAPSLAFLHLIRVLIGVN